MTYKKHTIKSLLWWQENLACKWWELTLQTVKQTNDDNGVQYINPRMSREEWVKIVKNDLTNLIDMLKK